jgi:DNA-binding transcriptional ArsR family regulator
MSEDEQPKSQPRLVSDAQTMRALAHPVRMDLLDLIRREGEITATRAAEALDESPGNMSWHLQTLAKYGFVEETGDGKGRSRPWRLVTASNRFKVDIDDPAAGAAGDVLVNQFVSRAVEKQRQWMADRNSYAPEWRDEGAFLNGTVNYLTPDEVTQISDEIVEIFQRYNERDDPSKRPPDALPVQLTAFGHPLPPTPSGN